MTNKITLTIAEVEAFQRLGYRFVDNKAVKACGSCANYRTEEISLNIRVEGYNGEVYYSRHYHDFSESGSPSDHNVEGDDYMCPLHEFHKERERARESMEHRRSFAVRTGNNALAAQYYKEFIKEWGEKETL